MGDGGGGGQFYSKNSPFLRPRKQPFELIVFSFTLLFRLLLIKVCVSLMHKPA